MCFYAPYGSKEMWERAHPPIYQIKGVAKAIPFLLCERSKAMTDNFKFIYKILRTLEAAMDYPEFDISQISAEKLGITSERWT